MEFKDFFNNNFLRIKNLFEMAIRGDVAKKPVNFDEDDIEFLQQFPHSFWIKAKKQRYDMLFDAIEKLHHERRALGHDKLKDAVKKAIIDKNWEPLKEILPEVDRFSRHFNNLNLSAKQIDYEADKIAHEQMKSKTDRIIAPEEVEFIFPETDYDPNTGKQGQRSTKKTVTYVAKPFLNRLYHKLERTKGLPHLPGSGLEGTEGKYGYDMAEPIRSPKEELPNITSGMKFPTETQIADRVKDFLNLNQHRIFGELPEDVVWLPTKYQDRVTVGWYGGGGLQNELIKKVESELRSKGTYENNSDLRKDATEIARKQVIELAKAGKLKGPPIPGKFPDGIPVEVEGPEGKEKLKAPPLYLPHQLKDVKVKQSDGTIKAIKREVPIIKPAHYFRELGSHEEDFKKELDAEGNERQVYDSNGDPVYDVPENKLRGYNKQYVHVNDDEFVPKKHRAAGALDFNANQKGIQTLSPGDEEYEEAYEKVFGSQKHVLLGHGTKLVPTEGAGFFEDIMKGILNCYHSEACGGATAHEKNILLQNIEDMHQLVVQTMLMDLRRKSLETSGGIRAYARSEAAKYMQKDQGQGGGTRRKRQLKSRNTSMDATKDGEDISDVIMGSIKDKDKLAGGESEIDRPEDKRGRGGRVLDTSGHKNAYSLANMRTAYEQIQKLSQNADKNSVDAIAMSRQQSGQEIIDILEKGMKERGEATQKITNLLASLYQQSGNSEEDSLNIANQTIKGWVEEGHRSSEQLLKIFKQHPLVQNAMGEHEQKDKEKEQEAINLFHHDLATMRSSGATLIDPRIKDILTPQGQEFSPYVINTIGKKFDNNPKIMSSVQREIDKIYRTIEKPQELNKAAKEVEVDKKSQLQKMRDLLAQRKTVPTPTGSYHDLLNDKKYLELAHHPEFLKVAHINNLYKMLDWFNQNKDKFQPHEYHSAVQNINKAIQEKHA